MALSSACGSFNITTGSVGSKVSVTGLGFQPKAILLFWTGRTATGAGEGTKVSGFGAATGVGANWAVGTVSVDNAADAVAASAHTDAACLVAMDAVKAVSGLADLDSLDAGGFTLEIQDQFPDDLLIHYLALGGDSLTNAVAGSFLATGTPPNTQDVTGLGFQPTSILFAGAGIQQTPPRYGNSDSILMLGVANASAEWVSAGGSNDNAATMNTNTYTFNGECVAGLSGNTSLVAERGSLSQFLSDGFQISWVERSLSPYYFYLALAGADVGITSVSPSNTLDAQYTVPASPFSFTPSAIMVVSQGKPSDSQDTTSPDDGWSIGFATGPTSRTVGATFDGDNFTVAGVSTAARSDAVYAKLTQVVGFSPSIKELMDVVSFNAGSVTFATDLADVVSADAWVVMFGPAPSVGGLSIPIAAYHYRHHLRH